LHRQSVTVERASRAVARACATTVSLVLTTFRSATEGVLSLLDSDQTGGTNCH
jgi:hypothetical protein